MARKKTDNAAPVQTTLQQAIASGVQKMLDAHYEEAMAYLEESDAQKIKITFGITVDLTKSEPQVDVGIRFSQAVTDSVSMSLTDINQGEFEEIVKDDGGGDAGPLKGESAEPEKNEGDPNVEQP